MIPGSTIIEKLNKRYRNRTMEEDSDGELTHDIVTTFRSNTRVITTLYMLTTKYRFVQYLPWVSNPSIRRPTAPAPPTSSISPPLRNEEVSDEHLHAMDADQLRLYLDVIVDEELHDRVTEQLQILEISLDGNLDRWTLDIDNT